MSRDFVTGARVWPRGCVPTINADGALINVCASAAEARAHSKFCE
jgi:hypothetical protein